MTTPSPSGTDQANLIDFLTRFYSTGQLHLLLIAYESDKPIPGRSEEEKIMRRDALRTILNKHPQPTAAPTVAKKKRK